MSKSVTTSKTRKNVLNNSKVTSIRPIVILQLWWWIEALLIGVLQIRLAVFFHPFCSHPHHILVRLRFHGFQLRMEFKYKWSLSKKRVFSWYVFASCLYIWFWLFSCSFLIFSVLHVSAISLLVLWKNAETYIETTWNNPVKLQRCKLEHGHRQWKFEI